MTTPIAAPIQHQTLRTVRVARFDLEEEIRQMRSTAPSGAAGHLARTLVRTASLRLVLVVMQRGSRLHEHQSESRLTIQGIDGLVRLQTPETFDLAPGSLLALDRNVSYALDAIEDSSILLTIAWQGHRNDEDVDVP